MSSLSSVFNSCATLVTMDVYKRLAPHHSERRLVVVGQLVTVLMVLFGLAWIPLMDLISGQLYVYIQSVQAYISPPIAAVFLLGVLWPRANARGALAALFSGLVLGLGRLVVEVGEVAMPAGLEWFGSMNFLHFAIVLFVVCSATLVLVSCLDAAARRSARSTVDRATRPRRHDTGPDAHGRSRVERGVGRARRCGVAVLLLIELRCAEHRRRALGGNNHEHSNRIAVALACTAATAAAQSPSSSFPRGNSQQSWQSPALAAVLEKCSKKPRAVSHRRRRRQFRPASHLRRPRCRHRPQSPA